MAMFIVNQAKDAIWNMDKFGQISLDGKSICIAEQQRFCLGYYKTLERAAEVFGEIMYALENKATLVKMPEE